MQISMWGFWALALIGGAVGFIFGWAARNVTMQEHIEAIVESALADYEAEQDMERALKECPPEPIARVVINEGRANEVRVNVGSMWGTPDDWKMKP